MRARSGGSGFTEPDAQEDHHHADTLEDSYFADAHADSHLVAPDAHPH